MDVPPQEFPADAPSDSITVRAIKDVTFGGIAGICSKVFEHP